LCCTMSFPLLFSWITIIIARLDNHAQAISSWSSGMDTYMSESWAVLSRMPQPSCVDIPRNFTLCHGIDYARMRLPNLVDHETLDEAVQQAAPWISLLRLNCHPDTQRFLCSLFAPVCLERAIYPCRSLCEAVKSGCEKRMQMYGFPWPEMLNCNKFPITNDMCIQPHENYQVNKSCTSCNQVKLKSVSSNYIVVQKARSIKPRETETNLRQSDVELKLQLTENNENCPCSSAKAHRNKRYLAMAYHGRNGVLVLNLLLPWRKEKVMFRKLDCKTLGTQIRERARRERRKKLRAKAKAAAARLGLKIPNPR
ncbi:Secreted frizzled-related protein 5, partial [Trichinella pseudospiralis]